jgi:hypothetical protein
MKRTAQLKIPKLLLLIACLAGAEPIAQAVNYVGSDLLLIFHKDGFNDIEFDQGPISAYVGLPSGTQKVVSYDVGLVKSNFNDSLADVQFLLVSATALGATQPRAWITDFYTSTPTDFTASKFSQIRSKISSVGQQASILTSSNALPAVIAPDQPGSFTYISSDANLTPANSLGGLTGFPMDAVIPGNVSLYEFQISTVTPRPAASMIGTFALDASGNLNFTSGSGPVLTAPTITGITRSGNAVTITFQSVAGLKYQLSSAPSLPAKFTTVGNAVTGDGTVQTLSDASSDPVRFYQIQTSL